MTLSLVVLSGTLGFVTDLGWGYYKQQSAQAAAEAAALAAAAYATANGSTCGTGGVSCSGTPVNCSTVSGTSAFKTACEYAVANGFTDGSNGQNVSLTAGGAGSPPGSPGVTVNYWVSASVTQSLFQTFSAVLGNNTLHTTGSSVTAASVAGPSGGTIYVLGPGSGTVTTNSSGAGAALNSGSDIYVNSTSSSAVTLKNADSVTCTGGGHLNVCGSGCRQHGATISPAPRTNCANHPDPYANMQPPSYPWWNCDYWNDVNYNSGNHTLNPGHYCGSINISGSATVTFSSGLYEIDGNLSVNTGCTVNLTAPTSGTWQGIAIYQDRNNTNTCTLTCGPNQKISGVVYAPSATVNHCGGSAGATPNQTIVCNKIQFTGTTNTHIGATSAYTCTPGVLVR
jgi:Flp pilus assembly protein TadG